MIKFCHQGQTPVGRESLLRHFYLERENGLLYHHFQPPFGLLVSPNR